MLIVPARGLLVMAAAVAFIWLWIGGDRVTCEGAADEWHCRRGSSAVMLEVLGLGGASFSGPNKETKTETVARRGRYAAVIHSGGVDFRLPSQPTRDLAEADRRMWLGWAHAPAGTLTLGGPTETRFVVLAWGWTLLGLASLIASAWSWWHGPTDRKRTGPSKQSRG